MEQILKASAEQEYRKRRRWWFHWQNLNDKKDGTQGSGFRYGRCWWHFGEHHKNIEFCWNLWGGFCGAQIDIDDEDVTLMLAFPPVSFWLSFSTAFRFIRRILPTTRLEHYPDTVVIDEREIGVRVHSGSVWLNFWSRRNEHRSADPWWIRGVNFSINPFEWKFMRHEVRCWDAFATRSPYNYWALVPSCKLGEEQKEPIAEEFAYPYTYHLKSGEIQNRTATVKVERRAWRPRCLRWTSLFEKVRTVIDVAFSDEVGEGSGSWKGGTLGCGYEMRPGESPEQCLRRMELDRKF